MSYLRKSKGGGAKEKKLHPHVVIVGIPKDEFNVFRQVRVSLIQ